MSAATDLARRLRLLEDVLAESRAAESNRPSPASADPVDLRLQAVRLQRIQQIASELEQRSDSELDSIDKVMLRLLLDEYTTAVGHLRAVAVSAEKPIADAWLTIEEGKRLLRYYVKAAAAKGTVT